MNQSHKNEIPIKLILPENKSKSQISSGIVLIIAIVTMEEISEGNPLAKISISGSSRRSNIVSKNCNMPSLFLIHVV